MRNQEANVWLTRTTVLPLWEMDVEIGGHKAKAVIDSGASVNLISKNLVDKFGLKTYMTDRRFSLRPVDGNVLKTEMMNQEVKEEVLLVNDGIRSTVRFVIIKKTQYQLLLGLPWLKEVNPKIDWRRQTASLLMTQIKNVSTPNKKNGEWLVAWREEVHWK